MQQDDQVTHFARTNYRTERLFGIRRGDRRAHMYMIGKTGTGKSTLLRTLVLQDIQNGEGLGLLDPHGDLVKEILEAIPESQKCNVIYFNVPDTAHALSFNPLADVPPLKRPLVAAGLLEIFAKIWSDAWGPRLEHVLRNTLLALLDQPGATLADVLRMFDDGEFRTAVIAHVTNHQVRRFWLQEYARYAPGFRSGVIAPIQNKIGAFLADPVLNRILTQPKSDINLRQLMDEGKILLINLAKGEIGESPAALLGALLVAQIGFAGLSRANVPETERRDFYLYMDEFQTFATLNLATLLSELRKYRVNLILANQYLSQVDRQVEDAILGNVGTLITFRVGPRDADFLAKEFSGQFKASDLMNLPNYNLYLRLMINGAVSPPFSARTLNRIEAACILS